MPLAGADQIKDVNARYHDVAAAEYDSKWSITFDSGGQANVVGKLERALGRPPGVFQRSLEIGAGTGYFTLNLLRAGVVGEATATDISRGMLDRLSGSARGLGLAVETCRSDAADLPLPDGRFDLVVGHAVLHHLPDLDAAFAEFRRVLAPGGTLVFCGEPSRHGNRLASLPKRAAVAVAPAWRRLMGASARRTNGSGAPHEHDHAAEIAASGLSEHEMEWLVDVHAFTPGDLSGLAERAGLESVHVRGEELTANWFGWVSRTLEGSAEPDEVPIAWRWYAYGGYRALRVLDRTLLEPRLPPAIFYNLLLSARAPEA